MFFPLRSPAAWRVIAIGPRASRASDVGDAPQGEESLTRGELALDELQSAVDYATGGTVQLRDPAWLTHFRPHHRQARRYRKGRYRSNQRKVLSHRRGSLFYPVSTQPPDRPRTLDAAPGDLQRTSRS
jgi:hypothetical protein